MKINQLKLFGAAILLAFGVSCGEGEVELDGSTYHPKIVIQGYVFPGRKVENIVIMRNIPLGGRIRLVRDSLFLPNAEVLMTAPPDTTRYELTYNPAMKSFEYNGSDLIIEHNRAYRLSVKAVIDGDSLEAEAETVTPQEGFGIVDSLTLTSPMHYRETDPSGALKFFTIRFTRSPNVDSYILSFTALDGDSSTFVYSPVNPFADVDTSDVVKYLRMFKYTNDLALNMPMSPGISEHQVLWFNLWFYGHYQAVVYACDRNFKDFYLTHGSVQEMDGNFHEPVMYIRGDGIGVFGSAIADTAFFTILK